MNVIDAKWDGRTAFKVPEAAEILRMSAWSTYQAIKEKQIPAIRIGRRVLIPRVALEHMLTGAA